MVAIDDKNNVKDVSANTSVSGVVVADATKLQLGTSNIDNRFYISDNTGNNTFSYPGILYIPTTGSGTTLNFQVKENGLLQKIVTDSQKVPAPQVRKIGHSFKWVLPMEIDPEKYMMIKGVAMTEGEMKRGEVMTRDNITFGAGAMSTAAMFGIAQIDIDHYESRLPAIYESKYGEDINNPYPPAFIFDAAVEDNVIEGENGEKKTIAQVEFIGFCVNPKVYQLIKDKKFVGTSVVDYYRKEACECGVSGGGCNCSIEGSHFLTLTLVLDEVPNSNGTWVAPVTKEDIGTIIVKADMPGGYTLRHSMKEMLMKKANSIKEVVDAKAAAASGEANKKQTVDNSKMVNENKKTYDLGKYWNDDKGWFDENSVAVIEQYLVDEKGLSVHSAHEIAAYLVQNPKALSKYQLEYLSAMDLLAWFYNTKNMAQVASIISNKFDAVMDVLKMAGLIPKTPSVEKTLENGATIKVTSGSESVKITVGGAEDAKTAAAPEVVATTPATATNNTMTPETVAAPAATAPEAPKPVEAAAPATATATPETAAAPAPAPAPPEVTITGNVTVTGEVKVDPVATVTVAPETAQTPAPAAPAPTAATVATVTTPAPEVVVVNNTTTVTVAEHTVKPEDVKPTAIVEKNAVADPKATKAEKPKTHVDEKRKVLERLKNIGIPAGRVNGAEMARVLNEYKHYVERDIDESTETE